MNMLRKREAAHALLVDGRMLLGGAQHPDLLLVCLDACPPPLDTPWHPDPRVLRPPADTLEGYDDRCATLVSWPEAHEFWQMFPAIAPAICGWLLVTRSGKHTM